MVCADIPIHCIFQEHTQYLCRTYHIREKTWIGVLFKSPLLVNNKSWKSFIQALYNQRDMLEFRTTILKSTMLVSNKIFIEQQKIRTWGGHQSGDNSFNCIHSPYLNNYQRSRGYAGQSCYRPSLPRHPTCNLQN